MRRAAFSLIEVLIALTLGVVVLTTTVSLVVYAGRESDAARRRAHLSRSASFLNLNLTRDLRAAGLGVPNGPFHDVFFDGSPGRFNAAILIGNDEAIGLVGDLPRPDADAPPFGSLATMPGNDGSVAPNAAARFWWFNDANGLCIPRIAGDGCTTAQTSRLLPGVAGCNRPGAGGDATCPWGLRRLLPNEYFTVIAGDGSWALAKMPADLSTALVPAPDGQHILFQSAGTPADWKKERWGNTNPQVDPPTALRGQGFVASLDRVFIFKRGSAVFRMQCMGVPVPDNVNFPSADVLTMPDPSQLDYAVTGREKTTCVGPELVADHVRSFHLTFVDGEGKELTLPLNAADKRAVRGVRWSVDMEDDRSGKLPVRESMEGAVALRNLP